MSSSALTIRPVRTKKDKKAFVDLAWEVYKDDPAWVPPLKDEVHGLITPGKNPWFEHAKAEFWLAERGGQGRRPHQRSGRRARAGAYGHRASATGACSKRSTTRRPRR